MEIKLIINEYASQVLSGYLNDEIYEVNYEYEYPCSCSGPSIWFQGNKTWELNLGDFKLNLYDGEDEDDVTEVYDFSDFKDDLLRDSITSDEINAMKVAKNFVTLITSGEIGESIDWI